jgi:hypothetical protein
MAKESEPRQFNFKPKDMLTICTYMFTFSIAFATLLVTFSPTPEISRIYAGAIIMFIGVPFGLATLITSISIAMKSGFLFKVSKIWLVISYICFFLTLLWVGLVVLLNIDLQPLIDSIWIIAGIVVPVLFSILFVISGLQRRGDVSQIMDAYFALTSETKPFDTIIYLRSKSSLFYDSDLLFGNPLPEGGFEPPLINPYRKIPVDEKTLDLPKFKLYVAHRQVLLMIENETLIRKALETIKMCEGFAVGCLILSDSDLSDSDLQAFREEFKIPFQSKKTFEEKKK